MIRITSFQKLGIKYIALKPGSTESLGQTVAIARAHPTFPLICQWTGGRAGGHHSFEDFHAPILSMYSTLRRYPNIILIAGSGFGGADDTEPYLTGEIGRRRVGKECRSRWSPRSEEHTSELQSR